jgi:predicted nucleic acid-binding Zn ribbon protein
LVRRGRSMQSVFYIIGVIVVVIVVLRLAGFA